MLEYNLVIPRGAVFYPHLWALIDRDGNPIRATDGLSVVAKVRRYLGDDSVLHTFATSVALMTVPGHYGNQPVAAAQLDEISHTATAALTWDRGVWDFQVNHEQPIVGGLVDAPLVVSR